MFDQRKFKFEMLQNIILFLFQSHKINKCFGKNNNNNKIPGNHKKQKKNLKNFYENLKYVLGAGKLKKKIHFLKKFLLRLYSHTQLYFQRRCKYLLFKILAFGGRGRAKKNN